MSFDDFYRLFDVKSLFHLLKTHKDNVNKTYFQEISQLFTPRILYVITWRNISNLISSKFRFWVGISYLNDSLFHNFVSKQYIFLHMKLNDTNSMCNFYATPNSFFRYLFSLTLTTMQLPQVVDWNKRLRLKHKMQFQKRTQNFKTNKHKSHADNSVHTSQNCEIWVLIFNLYSIFYPHENFHFCSNIIVHFWF